MQLEVDKTILEDNPVQDAKIDRIGQLTEQILTSDTSKTRTQHVIKAHIASLVSALGGPDHTSETFPPPYRLGVNALAVLKDLKRWLKFDKASKKWDVALACAETGLIANDLLNILYQWEMSYQNGQIFSENKIYNDRIASLCLELLVPLTWPLQLIDHESSVNQVQNYQKLRNHQLLYKKQLLSFHGGIVFKAMVRIVIPIISKPKFNRSVRDNSMLNLCVLFFRNVLSIAPDNTSYSLGKSSKSRSNKTLQPVSSLPADVSMEDISLSAVISVLDDNKVLKFFLTLFAGLRKEFDDEILGFGCLECLYYLTNGVKISSLLYYNSGDAHSQNIQKRTTSDPNAGDARSTAIPPAAANAVTLANPNPNPNPKQTVTSAGSELQDLLKKENKLKTRFIKDSASRHSRFGSLLSLDTIETGRLTVSGQKALMSTEKTMERLNETKRWKAQAQRIANSSESDEFNNENKVQYLSSHAQQILAQFAETFIDGGFNQFISVIGKKFHGEEKIDLHCIQYCLVTAWFLQYERTRKDLAKKQKEEEEEEKQQEKAKSAGRENDNEPVGDSELARLLYSSDANKQKDAEQANNNDTGKDLEEEEEEEVSEFGLVASTLLEDNIRLIKVFLKQEHSNADVSVCHATIIALKEILLLLNEMARSQFEQDVDISIATKKKIFTDEEFLSSLVTIAKKSVNKNITYLLSVVEILDISFKILENLNKDETLVIVNQIKKSSSSKQITDQNTTEDSTAAQAETDEDIKKRVRIKEFDFKEFFSRFINESTINAYMRLFKDFDKIDTAYLKKAIKFYHRIFFSFKQHAILLRLDFLAMLHEILAPRNRSIVAAVRLELEDFFKYYMKALRYHLNQTPILSIELLFPKFKESIYYLNTGEKPIIVEKQQRKVADIPDVPDEDEDFDPAVDGDVDPAVGNGTEGDNGANNKRLSLNREKRQKANKENSREKTEKTEKKKKKKKKLVRKRNKKNKDDDDDDNDNDNDDDEEAGEKKAAAAVKKYTSAMYIDSSDDESDHEADQLFFEKEKKMRQLMDRNGGLISKAEYDKFNQEFFAVIENGGSISDARDRANVAASKVAGTATTTSSSSNTASPSASPAPSLSSAPAPAPAPAKITTTPKQKKAIDTSFYEELKNQLPFDPDADDDEPANPKTYSVTSKRLGLQDMVSDDSDASDDDDDDDDDDDSDDDSEDEEEVDDSDDDNDNKEKKNYSNKGNKKENGSDDKVDTKEAGGFNGVRSSAAVSPLKRSRSKNDDGGDDGDVNALGNMDNAKVDKKQKLSLDSDDDDDDDDDDDLNDNNQDEVTEDANLNDKQDDADADNTVVKKIVRKKTVIQDEEDDDDE